jgi:ABC-type bacteriocin/lantibiotic exporter with double-glycine peptidase domain
VFLFALLEAGILAFVGARAQSLMESDLACQSESQSYLTEVLTGISTLKASGAEEQVVNRWFDLLSRQLNASVQRSRFLAGIDTAMNAIRTFAPLCLLWLGATQVLEGAMSLGTMLAINALAAAFLMPVNSLVVSAQRIQLAAAHLRRIADVLHAQPEQSPDAPRPAQGLTGAIELRNVSFQYDSQGPLVLKNISLSIRSGQKIALVGRTGSGKSTLARLLLGLYTPAEGEILYDGVPLSEMDLRAVRAQWGVVLQEQFLFSASLRENIALHHPVMPLDQVRSAARMAAIDREIERMPMGYETRIDEGGSCLSGGQRQRLAIARAVSHMPALLLLDEATSQLDVLTEALVHRNLDRLGCTQIVVAHRLSTIRNADVIVVLEEGSIVEQGSHQELIGRKARYAELVCSQMDENLIPLDVV